MTPICTVARKRSGCCRSAESAPERGGPLRGRASLVRLAGDTWEELVFEADTFLHLAYPRPGVPE